MLIYFHLFEREDDSNIFCLPVVSRWLQQLGLVKSKPRSQTLRLGLPCGWKGFRCLDHHLPGALSRSRITSGISGTQICSAMWELGISNNSSTGWARVTCPFPLPSSSLLFALLSFFNFFFPFHHFSFPFFLASSLPSLLPPCFFPSFFSSPLLASSHPPSFPLPSSYALAALQAESSRTRFGCEQLCWDWGPLYFHPAHLSVCVLVDDWEPPTWPCFNLLTSVKSMSLNTVSFAERWC